MRQIPNVHCLILTVLAILVLPPFVPLGSAVNDGQILVSQTPVPTPLPADSPPLTVTPSTAQPPPTVPSAPLTDKPDFVERYQTLITGVLAILAAAIVFWGSRKQATATVQAGRENIAFVERSSAEQLKRTEDRVRAERVSEQLVLASIVIIDSHRLHESIQKRDATLSLTDNGMHNITNSIRVVDIPPTYKLEWRELALLGDEGADHIKRAYDLLVQFNHLLTGQQSERRGELEEAERRKRLQEICKAFLRRSESLNAYMERYKETVRNQAG